MVQGQRRLSAEPQASNSLLFYFRILETKSSKQTSNQANKKCPSPIKLKKASKQAVLWVCSLDDVRGSQGDEPISSVPLPGVDLR